MDKYTVFNNQLVINIPSAKEQIVELGDGTIIERPLDNKVQIHFSV